MAKEKIVRLNVGIPASGKTTESKLFISENPGWVRVSRDDFRFMLKNLPQLDNKSEELVNDLMINSIRTSLLAGFNVIVDNTHCRLKYINDMIKELNDLAEIQFRVFHIELDEAIKRDALRDRPVGPIVIGRMHENYVKLVESFDFKPVPKSVRIAKEYTATWKIGNDDAIICDIDGTLAHMNGRRGPFDWSKVGVDAVDVPMVMTLIAMARDKYKILLVSGRDGSCRAQTEEWLRVNGIPYDELYMRPTGDFRKDSIIKQEIWEDLIKNIYNVVMVYDDRDQVVKVWRDLGLKCAQVEPGQF
jgi:predicted kinase